MRVQKSLIVGAITFPALLLLTLRALGAQALSGSCPLSAVPPVPTAISISIPPQEDELSPKPIFDSPIFVAIVWPVAFVILEVTLNTLASTSVVRSEGSRKFRVWHTTADGHRVETSPVDLGWLKTGLANQEILDIEVLAPGTLESFAFGLDLCIGALSTDLAIIYAVLSSRIVETMPQLVTTAVSVLVLHFITATVTVFILRAWSNHESRRIRVVAMQAANFMGLIAIFSSFLILGNLIVG